MSDQNINKIGCAVEGCSCNTPGHHSFTFNPSYLPYAIPVEKYESIKIKYLVEGLTEIHYIEGEKSDWIDLRAAKDIELKQWEYTLIPLGIAVHLPKGYEALVIPRSSTYQKYGIIQANSIGVIDESYCGDDDMWKWPVIALRDTFIHKNDRICQFRILQHQPKTFIFKVETLSNTSRGGFGSTGHK